MSYARKVDANQGRIVRALRQVGAAVHPAHTLADGAPDLLVGYRHRAYLLEVKAAKGQLTPAQKRFHARFPVTIVRDEQAALKAIGALS